MVADSLLLFMSPFCRHFVKCFYLPAPYGSAFGSVVSSLITIEYEVLPRLCNSDAVETATLSGFGDEKVDSMFPSFVSILRVNAVSLAESLLVHMARGYVMKGECL